MSNRRRLCIDATDRLAISFEASMEMHAIIATLRNMLERVTFADYPDEVVVLALMDRAKIVAQVGFDAGNTGEDEHHDRQAWLAAIRVDTLKETHHADA